MTGAKQKRRSLLGWSTHEDSNSQHTATPITAKKVSLSTVELVQCIHRSSEANPRCIFISLLPSKSKKPPIFASSHLRIYDGYSLPIPTSVRCLPSGRHLVFCAWFFTCPQIRSDEAMGLLVRSICVRRSTRSNQNAVFDISPDHPRHHILNP